MQIPFLAPTAAPAPSESPRATAAREGGNFADFVADEDQTPGRTPLEAKRTPDTAQTEEAEQAKAAEAAGDEQGARPKPAGDDDLVAEGSARNASAQDGDIAAPIGPEPLQNQTPTPKPDMAKNLVTMTPAAQALVTALPSQSSAQALPVMPAAMALGSAGAQTSVGAMGADAKGITPETNLPAGMQTASVGDAADAAGSLSARATPGLGDAAGLGDADATLRLASINATETARLAEKRNGQTVPASPAAQSGPQPAGSAPMPGPAAAELELRGDGSQPTERQLMRSEAWTTQSSAIQGASAQGAAGQPVPTGAAPAAPPSVEYRRLARKEDLPGMTRAESAAKQTAAGVQPSAQSAAMLSGAQVAGAVQTAAPVQGLRGAWLSGGPGDARRETGSEAFGLAAATSAEARGTLPTPVAGAPAARMDAQAVARQIADAMPRGSDGGFEVRLSPEELGTVRLRMVPGEGGLIVQVQADRPETLDLLRRNIDLLAQELSRAGSNAAGFSFADGSTAGSDERNAQGNRTQGGGTAGPASGPPAESADAPAMVRAGGIDIRL
jgi:flagellar hook-length control protein FliK